MALQYQRAHPAGLCHLREVDRVDGPRPAVRIGVHVNIDYTLKGSLGVSGGGHREEKKNLHVAQDITSPGR
jgi:hypothetical protein